MSCGELSGRNFVCEKKVQLFIGAAFYLGEPEVGPHKDTEGGRSPEEAGSAS